jgi:hypothetical protein
LYPTSCWVFLFMIQFLCLRVGRKHSFLLTISFSKVDSSLSLVMHSSLMFRVWYPLGLFCPSLIILVIFLGGVDELIVQHSNLSLLFEAQIDYAYLRLVPKPYSWSQAFSWGSRQSPKALYWTLYRPLVIIARSSCRYESDWGSDYYLGRNQRRLPSPGIGYYLKVCPY